MRTGRAGRRRHGVVIVGAGRAHDAAGQPASAVHLGRPHGARSAPGFTRRGSAFKHTRSLARGKEICLVGKKFAWLFLCLLFGAFTSTETQHPPPRARLVVMIIVFKDPSHARRAGVLVLVDRADQAAGAHTVTRRCRLPHDALAAHALRESHTPESSTAREPSASAVATAWCRCTAANRCPALNSRYCVCATKNVCRVCSRAVRGGRRGHRLECVRRTHCVRHARCAPVAGGVSP